MHKMFNHFVASPCLLKILLAKFSSAKMVSLFHRLPLGGKLSLKATDEGRNIFSLQFFKQRAHLVFPFAALTESLLSPSGRVASLCEPREVKTADIVKS